ncbi:MAG: LolA-like outer membrane lipoprotein chaperone [Campylobacter sp.]|nr:LolA-like outer membrane lipoprotein chaperone [Campylobacter sp.]
MKKILFTAIFSLGLFGADLSFKTLQSDFVQVVNSKDSIVNYTGTFYAKSDNTALWIYKSPTPKKIYFNKTHVVVIEDELEQAVITSLDDTPNLTLILSSAKKITSELYKASYDGTDYFISIKNGVATAIDYADKLDNKIKITLKNLKKDIAISKELLTPKIPQNYDVVTQ